MIKTGVIGFGASAKTFHLPFINTLDEFQAVAISSSQSEAVRTEYPQVSHFLRAEDLIAGAELDLVVITAPNDVHYALAKQCLQRGINVVVEKPMVTTTAEADELIELAAQNSCLLSVFHNRRWDGDFLTVKQLLEKNALGEVRFFESHFDRFRPALRIRWRENPGPGNGLLYDLGSHLVDQGLQLFGIPEAITAHCRAQRENSQVTDYFHLVLHYQRMEAVLHASCFTAAPNRRFYLEGTTGTFVKHGLDPQEDQLKAGMLHIQKNYGVDPEENYGRLFTEIDNRTIATDVGCYQRYYAALAAAINSGAECPVTGEDGRLVMKMLDLAVQSNETGRTVEVEQN